MTREAILSEIRRTAQENGGVALGKKRFLDATGSQSLTGAGAIGLAGVMPSPRLALLFNR